MPLIEPPPLWLPSKPAIIRPHVARKATFFPYGGLGIPAPVVQNYIGDYTTNNNTTGGTTMSDTVGIGTAFSGRAIAMVFTFLSDMDQVCTVSSVSMGGNAGVVAVQANTARTLTVRVGTCIAVAFVPSGTSAAYSVTFSSNHASPNRMAIYALTNLHSLTPRDTAFDTTLAAGAGSSSNLVLDLNSTAAGIIIAESAHYINPAAGSQSWAGALTVRETFHITNFYYSNASALFTTNGARSVSCAAANGADGAGVSAAFR